MALERERCAIEWPPPPPTPGCSSSQTCAKQHIGRDELTIPADRGSSMTSKPVAFLLADLSVTSPTAGRTSK